MNKNILWMVGILVVIAGGLALFGMHASVEDASGKLRVTASFYPVYYFAQEIGGEYANVTNITPAGADSHDFEPTPQDVVAITNSNLFVMNGAGFEAWGERVITELPSTVVVVEAGEGLAILVTEEEEEHAHEHEEGETHEEGHAHEHGLYDPHVWLSLSLASGMVDAILGGFIEADPEHRTEYEANAAALKARLSELEGEFRQGLSSCAKDEIITSHTAFGYIAQDYGLRQEAITGLAHEAEPSAQQLAELAEFAREHNVEYIFFETLISPQLAETLANEVGAETLVLNPLEGLTDEELAQGKDYLTEMRANLANLKVALSCN